MTTTTRRTTSTTDLALIATFAALLAVCAQASLPFGVNGVPLTLQGFAIFLAGAVLGWWRESSVVQVVSTDEVHAVYRAPVAELCDPAHRITVKGPGGWSSPGFLIGDDKDVICWGFTAGIIARLFEYLGWIEDLPDAPEQELPSYMLAGRRLNEDVLPNTEFDRRRGA